MRRITVQIRSKRNPEVIVAGYIVLHELGTEVLSFFSTKKFLQEEELEVVGEIHGEQKKYTVELLQCHEQISSGRVMTSLPTEGQPLPTRTFYRCFSKIQSLVALEAAPPETQPAEPVQKEPDAIASALASLNLPEAA